MSAKDDNGFPVIYGVSHRDGVTPIQIQFTDTGRVITDASTTIEFDPDINAFQTDNDLPIAKALDDDGNVRPWVVNEDTGAVLINNA